MKNRHSQFKSKHKITLSILSMLLLVCIVSTSVFAAEGDEKVGHAGVTTIGSTYNGDGVAGQSYSGVDPENIWGKMTRDSTGTYQANYGFMGYRMYVVDEAGNLQSKVIDLTYKKPSSYSNIKTYDTILAGVIDCDDPFKYEIKSIQSTTNQNEAMNTTGTPKVYTAGYYSKNDKTGEYSLGGGTYVLGERFATWMQTVDSSNIKNAKKLLQYAFGPDEAENYLNNSEWQVIIEPLLYADIWTTREWIQVEETHILEKYHEHFVYFIEDMPYDICCSETDENRMTQSDYIKWAVENYSQSYIGRALGYGIPTHYKQGILAGKELGQDYKDYLKNKYNNIVSVGVGHERQAASELGYGYISYEKLDSLEKKINVYNRMVDRKLSFCPETTYIKSIVDTGFVYLNSHPVYAKINGVDENVYADYSVAYGHKPSKSGWHEKVEGGIRKHYVSAYTGDQLYSTYNGVKNHLATVTNLSGAVGSDGGCTRDGINPVGSGFKLSTNAKFTDSTKNLSAGTQGIHMYAMKEIGPTGDPIHTKNPVDPTPSNPNDPITPEKPNKTTPPADPFDNTGKSTIIKVYGEIYKDGSTVYHIDHKATYSETQTTDWIVIEDESKYKLQQWVVSGGTPDTDYTTTEWLNTDGTYSFDKSTLFTNSSAGYKLTYTAEDNFRIGEGRTIYLLYLKTLPAIETSDTKVPDTTTDFEPTNPTYPEVPTGDKKKDPNGYNIIKVYTILDEYNGTPLSSETYTQSSTTPFIKIEQESNWTLAGWYTTNTHNKDVTGDTFFTEATNNSQLKSFYENGYNLKPSSAITSVIGNTLSSGTQPTTAYFTSGNTVYLLFTRTEGQANYDATQQLITESYLAKRFSTLGYWDALGFHKSDLTLTVTTDSKI